MLLPPLPPASPAPSRHRRANAGRQPASLHARGRRLAGPHLANDNRRFMVVADEQTGRHPRAAARARRRDRRAGAQPAAAAQQPIGSLAQGTVGGPDRDRERPHRARRGAGGERSGLLRRPRFERTHGAAQRRRRRQSLFPPHHDDLQRHDAADRHAAAAGDRLPCRASPAPPAASSSPVATSPSPPRRRSSRRPASTSACSARRRWWRCRATSRASTRWRCC